MCQKKAFGLKIYSKMPIFYRFRTTLLVTLLLK